jgi:autotransporter-associated beta strand protein
LNSTSTLDAVRSGGLVDITTNAITGAGGLNIASSGSSGGVVRFSVANTYDGDTTINSGAILRLNTANAMPFGSGKGNVSVTGTLDLNGNSAQINGLSGNGIVDGTSGTPTLTVGNNDATSSFGGIIQNTAGTLALTKTGGGTTTLTATNTYIGATTINAGTLKVDNNGSTTLGKITGSTAADSIKVNNGGTLLLAGTGSADRIGDTTGLTLNGGTLSAAGTSSLSETLGALTLTANSTIDFGTGNGNTLRFSSLTGLGTYSLTINNWTGPSYYTLSNDPNADPTQDRLLLDSGGFTPAQLAAISFYDDANNFLGTGKEILFNGNPAEIVPVPEPATVVGALLLAGFVGYRERRRLRVVGRLCQTPAGIFGLGNGRGVSQKRPTHSRAG